LVEQPGSFGRILSLRWISIVFGAAAVALVFAAGRLLAPGRPELSTLAAGIAAFIPMHTAMGAAINNDALAELMASATLVALLLGLRYGFDARGAVAVGALSAGLLLTKVSVYLFVPLALAILGLVSARPLQAGKGYQVSHAARQVGLAVAVIVALSGWWFWRNLQVYGPADPFGLTRHDQIVVGQPRWPGFGLESVAFFFYSTFRSFWAQFGWLAIVVDPRLYALFLLFGLLALAGLWWFWRDELPGWQSGRRAGLWLLLIALGLVVAEVIGYNLSFIQAQGRYLYPAMLPIGILLALGWLAVVEATLKRSRAGWWLFGLGFYWLWATVAEACAWLLTNGPAPLFIHLVTIGPTWLATRVQIRRGAGSMAAIACPAIVGALVLVNAVCLFRYVLPYFAGF
jgi:4-amino-4-deoxy-L-arabinose transferase-like glycosyltransferase